jgi:hypothetical protein
MLFEGGAASIFQRKMYVTCNVPKIVALGKEDLDVHKQRPYGILASLKRASL